LIIRDFERAFEKVDLIFTPTSPTLPFKLGEKIDDPLKMYLSDIFTVSVNLAGLPAISIPIGSYRKSSEKMPVGLQIIGQPFQEDKIFEVAKFYELSANSQ
jgi:aspartyl-tRNA(Asn)/glutamyl-tRNA(Gln) amidotransferase subunit A